ncbi:glyoxalase [Micromonospora sp. R77]|uniref:glyoxalase n=1 Tax=Micromonospora sp. R77 TaxID=2925836 RepID=UPI001F6026F8|nr:glyoxalase [Micromonospora sp. R77]MCI4066332.1 glyoxalase [Micromonospora sp. R77]
MPDPAAADAFYRTAFDLDARVRVRDAQAPTTGFRGFAMSLVVSQPSIVNSFFRTALDGGATTLKPAAKGFWGYGGVLCDPYGTIWKISSSSKKDSGPAPRHIDEIVLLLGVADVAATRKFYLERGLSVAKSFGRRYVEFATPPITLALYGRRAAAKDVGVSPDGSGSHRLAIGSGTGTFTDPDGFEWEAATSARVGQIGEAGLAPVRARGTDPNSGL